MKRIILSMLAVSALVFTSCSSEEESIKNELEVPATYEFVGENGESNVSYSGQIARLNMAAELKSALGKKDKTKEELDNMFTNGTGFEDADLDATGKKLRSTIASGTYTDVTSVQANELRAKVDGWINDYATDVYDNWASDASAGIAGKIVTGDRTAYVNVKGIEFNQAVAKTLIGSIFVDQTINKYTSEKFVDANKGDHEAGKPYKGDATKNYTGLQHGWDEGYGYVFGVDGTFLNKYLKKVDADTKFNGLLADVNQAFRTGRAAIDAKDYVTVKKQSQIINSAISKVIGVITVHYLQSGKGTRDANTLHALSEAYGFAISLRYAHNANGQLGANQVNAIVAALEADNGLWSVTDAKLDELSTEIASEFGFEVADAVSLKD